MSVFYLRQNLIKVFVFRHQHTHIHLGCEELNIDTTRPGGIHLHVAVISFPTNGGNSRFAVCVARNVVTVLKVIWDFYREVISESGSGHNYWW